MCVSREGVRVCEWGVADPWTCEMQTEIPVQPVLWLHRDHSAVPRNGE